VKRVPLGMGGVQGMKESSISLRRCASLQPESERYNVRFCPKERRGEECGGMAEEVNK